MAFDHDQDMEQFLQSVIDSGFLPPHPEALASVINTLWLPTIGERPGTLVAPMSSEIRNLQRKEQGPSCRVAVVSLCSACY